MSDGPFAWHRATPPGAGGIAVFELYGAGAGSWLGEAFGGRRGLPTPGRAGLGPLRDAHGEAVDEAVVTRVPAEASWCRLASWSVAVHAGPWVQRRVAEVLEEAGGERLDTRGVLERALEAGAVDAVEAAARELLPEARTERAASFLAARTEGDLSAGIRGVVEHLDAGPAGEAIPAARARLEALLAGARRGRRLVEPLRLLIAGRPNAGKSTLLNALAGRERALVARRAGTTRDLVTETVAFEGFPVELVDGAGLRASPEDAVEAQAVVRAREATADAALWLLAPPWRLAPEDRAALAQRPAESVLVVANFRDAPGGERAPWPVRISARDGRGLDTLRGEVARRWLGAGDGGEPATSSGAPAATPDPPAPFTARQEELLARAHAALEHGAGGLDDARAALVTCLAKSWPGPARAADPPSGSPYGPASSASDGPARSDRLPE